MLATVLQAQGYRVDVSPSAQAALERPARLTPTSSSSSTTACPTGSGVALLEAGARGGVLHGAAQMLFTGKASLQSSGTTAVLHKPIDLQDLVRQVHSIVGPPEGPGPPPSVGSDRRRKTAEARRPARATGPGSSSPCT